MASFSLEEVMEPATPPGQPSSHTPVTQDKKSFSLEEAVKGQEPPKGFFANLKNPLDLWMQESLPANIYKSISKHEDLWKKAEVSRTEEAADKETLSGTGQFSNNPRAVAEAQARLQKREAAKPTLAKMWESVKEDPGAAGAGFVNAFIADPWMALSAFGGPAGGLATRAAGGAAMGAATNVGIEAAREQATEGRVRPENMLAPAQVGALMGGGMNAAFGPRGRQGIRVTDPKQLFPDDAAHADFERAFRQPSTEVAVLEKPRAQMQEIVEPGSREWKASDTAKALGLAGVGTAAWELSDKDETALLAMAAGGIKAKGKGSWHPDVPRKLAAAIVDRMVPLARDAQENSPYAKTVKSYTQWAEDRVSRYLNKYAGTVDDPLKEIKLPNGDTWEKATDKVFKQKPAREYNTVRMNERGEWDPNSQRYPPEWLNKANPDEPIWSFEEMPQGWGGENQYAGRELTSYLSHVGDFLRQNVSPEKLPQYDLVRAVKETAKNDERVAKEMEKSRAASTAQLPVHKEYENGMKWVELKLPEKLSEEQAGGVRPATKEEIKQLGRGDPDVDIAPPDVGGNPFVAIDSKGKPIMNSYTQRPAMGVDAKEAWLAGRLAEEGNTMGHCVGGYCESVASGDSKIFSLRDKKGESHVTVEVIPGPNGGNLTRSGMDDIAQIKGKQNRALDPKYLPFVQDFVKGGKWGEVGDLEHTGLYSIKQASGSSYPHYAGQNAPARYNRNPADLDLKSGYYTADEITAAQHRATSFTDFKTDLKLDHPNVDLDLRESKSGAITLANIELKPIRAERRQRIEDVKGRYLTVPADQIPSGGALGQAAIREITSYADANGRGILLTAAGVPDGPPTPKLVEIYKRHGFVEDKYQPFPEIAVNMHRNAKGVKDGTVETEAGGSLQEVQESPNSGTGQAEGGMGGEGVRPEGPGIDQAGNIDKRLLFGLTAAGIGGVLGAQFLEDDPIRGMLWGATVLGILPYIAPMARTLAVTADPALGMLSTRIKNISEPIHRRALDFERNVLGGTTRYISAAAPFLRELGRNRDPELKRAIVSNDSAALRQSLLNSGNPALLQGWMQTRQALNEIGASLKAAGRIDTVLPDYFPRVVKDLDGLLNYFGKGPKDELSERISAARLKAASSGGISQIEESLIVNRWLQEQMRGGKPGFTKDRSIRQVTDDLMPFYADPAEAYTSYVHAAVNDLEKTKFFGKHLAKKNNSILPDESIGNLLREERQVGRIDLAGEEQLKRLLLSRFGPEDSKLPEGARNTIQIVQNLSYAGLLGNIVSASTQLGDSAMSVYAAGLGPTLSAVGRKLTGRMELNAEDLGIVNHISDEFTSQLKSAKFLQGVFKWGGFSLIDRLGKDLLTQASYTKFKDQSNSVGGRRDLAEKYSEAYGSDFPQLVSDLQGGQRTALTDSLIFANLSRMQPLTRLEAPELYNMAPAMRPLYMLKRWMLKQADVVRRDSYDEWRKGHQVKAVGNLTKFATVLGISGMAVGEVKDWILGKDPDEKEWVGKFADNVLKTFGWSSYATKQAEEGHPLKAVAGSLAPPYDMWDKIITADPKALDYLPIVGRMLRGHFEDKDAVKQEQREKAQRRRMDKILEGSK